MMTKKELSALVGRLSSAFKRRSYYGANFQNRMHEIIAADPQMIIEDFDKITRGDPDRQKVLIDIACEHLYYRPLRELIPTWLDSPPSFTHDAILRAVTKFKIREPEIDLVPYLLLNFELPDRNEPEEHWQYQGRRRYLAEELRRHAVEAIPFQQSERNVERLKLINAKNPSRFAEHISKPDFNSAEHARQVFERTSDPDEVAHYQRVTDGEISFSEAQNSNTRPFDKFRAARILADSDPEAAIEFFIKNLDPTPEVFRCNEGAITLFDRSRWATNYIIEGAEVAKTNVWSENTSF